jgi:hypothetical protein
VASERRHPLAQQATASKAQALTSKAMEEFEQRYRDNLGYSAARRLWIGKHVVAPFVVDFLA